MYYPIHDTHRVPYFNATITAKQLSDSTTPVKFIDADGNELGLSIKTNARGYLCQSNGTPYPNGVFVGEDAIITATLGDGSSTSWTVRSDSEITVFDGILYGKVLDPDTATQEELENAVTIGTTKYKRLFSANQSTDGQLSLWDLADVPSFSKWTDDQQIESLDLVDVTYKATVTLGIQTKTLLLTNSNTASAVPEYPKYFTVLLQSSLDEEGNTRFGRNVVITNFTGACIVLQNAQGSQSVLGRINPTESITVTEVYPDAVAGSNQGGTAFFAIADNGELANNGNVSYTLSATNELTINDSTPPLLNIAGFGSEGVGPNLEINLKYQGSAGVIRRVVLRRFDSVQKTAVVKDPNSYPIALLRNGESVELIVGADTNGTGFAGVADLAEKVVRTQQVPISTPGSLFPVTSGLNSVQIDCSQCTTSHTTAVTKLQFATNVCESYRLEFVNLAVPHWFQLVNDASLVQAKFCVPSGAHRVTVSNCCGILTIVEKSWDMRETAGKTTYSSNTWTCEYDSFDVVADLALLNSLTDETFAFNRGDNSQNLVLKLPIEDGQTADVRIAMPFYSSTITSGNPDVHLKLSDMDGNTVTIAGDGTSTHILFDSSKMDEEAFIAGGWTVTGQLSRAGTTLSFTLSAREAYK